MSDALASIWTCANNIEASVIRARLEDEGIDVLVQGENHRSQLGVLGSYVELAIMVPERDAARARAIIEAAEAQIGQLSVSALADGEGALSEADPFAEGGELVAQPERQPEPAVRRRFVAFPLLLALTITFGTGHAYARRFRTAIALAITEVVALILLFAGVEQAPIVLFGAILYDAVGGALAVRSDSRAR